MCSNRSAPRHWVGGRETPETYIAPITQDGHDGRHAQFKALYPNRQLTTTR